MVTSIFSMFANLFGNCAVWLGQLMTNTEMLPVWLGGVAVWLMYRFLLSPIFGVASSDTAKKIWRGSKESAKPESRSRASRNKGG